MSRSARLVSAIGLVLAAIYALPTLWWRFGRDQGLFESMGRGWLEGRMPYVGAWDQKPPAIHAVYALGAALGGAAEWPIRALEVLAVLLTGLVVASLAAGAHPREGQAEAAVTPGVATLFGAGFQFTCFCWWHTGQVEPWEALAVLGSALVAERAAGGRGWLLAGFLGGVAFLFKLPAVVLLAAIAGRLAWLRRAAPRDAAAAVGLYTVGGAVAVLLGVLPWLMTGTFGAMWELVVEYNAVYARHKAVHAVPVHVWAGTYAWPWLLPSIALAGAAARRLHQTPTLRDRWQGPLSWAAGLLVAALVTVAMQPNNYMYHWSVVVPFVTLLGAVSANTLLDGVDASPTRVLALTSALVLTGFMLAPRWEQQHEWNYRRYVVTWLDVQLGRAPAEQLLEGFRARHMKGPGARPFGYVWSDVERLSTAIRARAQAGDTLCARWFEPVFYTRTGLHCTSRFTTEHGWRDKDVPFKLAEWEAEHEGALLRTPPTFMVTRLTDDADRALLASRGYAEVAEAGRYVALELRK